MIIQTITVLGQEVYCELSTSIPIVCRESFNNDLIEAIEDAIQGEINEGTEEMYYIEEISDEQVETDVDVKWEVINWKSIATTLYEALDCICTSTVYEEETKEKAMEEYEKRYTDTSNTE